MEEGKKYWVSYISVKKCKEVIESGHRYVPAFDYYRKIEVRRRLPEHSFSGIIYLGKKGQNGEILNKERGHQDDIIKDLKEEDREEGVFVFEDGKKFYEIERYQLDDDEVYHFTFRETTKDDFIKDSKIAASLNPQVKEKVRAYLAQNKLEEALDLLNTNIEGRESKNTIILFASHF